MKWRSNVPILFCSSLVYFFPYSLSKHSLISMSDYAVLLVFVCLSDLEVNRSGRCDTSDCFDPHYTSLLFFHRQKKIFIIPDLMALVFVQEDD